MDILQIFDRAKRFASIIDAYQKLDEQLTELTLQDMAVSFTVYIIVMHMWLGWEQIYKVMWQLVRLFDHI